MGQDAAIMLSTKGCCIVATHRSDWRPWPGSRPNIHRKRRRRTFKIRSMGVQPPFGKGQHRLWAVLLAAHGKIIIGIPIYLNYCEIFIVCTEFTNVVAGRIIQPDGL
jgi:hypothetical protein